MIQVAMKQVFFRALTLVALVSVCLVPPMALAQSNARPLPPEEEVHGLMGEYGFLSAAVLGPQSEEAARGRVAVMAQEYGIREFMFYDWFADYSTPVRGQQWADPYFRSKPIDRTTLRNSIDEIHRQGGRAWAYVQSIGAEEKDLENPDADLWKLRDGAGKWYWHPPGENPRFPTYFANAAWAKHMVERWAPAIKQLGFDGIHWDTLGRIAGDGPAETAGMHAFIQTAHALLQRRGLLQTMNMVDLAWWDRKVVRDDLEFPYVEAWSPDTKRRYFLEMDQPDMAGIHGVLAMYPTVAMPDGWTETDVISARKKEAGDHRLVYLVVGDGARRMQREYWCDTVPLSSAERAVLKR